MVKIDDIEAAVKINSEENEMKERRVGKVFKKGLNGRDFLFLLIHFCIFNKYGRISIYYLIMVHYHRINYFLVKTGLNLKFFIPR